ncbi:hypothetical protein NDI37_19635 [Funiculus sociatus GB2-A5]|uniref:Uncharacterized protein n=1 Tax=Funiculus sociatus GB2-A5 TaxID=2933946 RepID=A0ABV0JT86_9CYAN|nr:MULTISPECIES: hypothetical protein [unclassified Trichocoleus]MBD1907596.1 hypothetical protein [Trichocoleus sp. FACHB-832]MBD2063715.1 hypothetical protein [Trichocoleus sp. FACHB-6]
MRTAIDDLKLVGCLRDAIAQARSEETGFLPSGDLMFNYNGLLITTIPKDKKPK